MLQNWVYSLVNQTKLFTWKMFPKSPLLDTAHIILSTDVYAIKILKACQLIALCIAEMTTIYHYLNVVSQIWSLKYPPDFDKDLQVCWEYIHSPPDPISTPPVTCVFFDILSCLRLQIAL